MQWPLVRRSAFRVLAGRLTAAREEAESARSGRDRAQEAASRLKEEGDRTAARLEETRAALQDTSLRLADAEAELASLRAAPDPMEGLTAEDVRDLLDTFRNDGACKTCGGVHVRSCPRVKSVEYDRQGDKVSIRRVVFWRKWDDGGVIFSDMLPDPDTLENGEADEPA